MEKKEQKEIRFLMEASAKKTFGFHKESRRSQELFCFHGQKTNKGSFAQN